MEDVEKIVTTLQVFTMCLSHDKNVVYIWSICISVRAQTFKSYFTFFVHLVHLPVCSLTPMNYIHLVCTVDMDPEAICGDPTCITWNMMCDCDRKQVVAH